MSDDALHPGEALEAYALGMLERDEGQAIDAHVRACDACAVRLGAAERTVATLLETTLAPERAREIGRVVPLAPRAARRGAWPVRIATSAAAALALATGVLSTQNAALHATARSDGALVRAMIASHFVHAQFRSPSGVPLDAKVVYERHGAWYAVLVADANRGWHVASVDRPGAEAQVLPQGFVRTGGAGVLRVAAPHPFAALELVDAENRLIGTAATPSNGGR